MSKNNETKYPATKIAHWATGPCPCCDEHAQQIVDLGGMLGMHVAITKAEDGEECTNCINEAKS
jgi:hypothetical protein